MARSCAFSPISSRSHRFVFQTPSSTSTMSTWTTSWNIRYRQTEYHLKHSGTSPTSASWQSRPNTSRTWEGAQRWTTTWSRVGRHSITSSLRRSRTISTNRTRWTVKSSKARPSKPSSSHQTSRSKDRHRRTLSRRMRRCLVWKCHSHTLWAVRSRRKRMTTLMTRKSRRMRTRTRAT